MAHRSDEQRIREDRNTARFFTENPQIAWVVLLATVAWGVYGYVKMPKRKDPDIPVGIAAAVCPWPGVPAEKIERLVTEKIEKKLAENPNVKSIESTVRTSVSVTIVHLRSGPDIDRELEDLRGKLESIKDLPENAGPVAFMKDFKDTATLMLTVASPRTDPVEIGLRARSVREAIEAARAGAAGDLPRASLVINFPQAARTQALRETVAALGQWLQSSRAATDIRAIERPTFLGLDAQVHLDDEALLAAVRQFTRDHVQASDLSPDVWAPALIHDPKQAESQLASVAGPRYSYRELDEYSDVLRRILLTSPKVSRVTRAGVLPEVVTLGYSQQRMAAYGLSPSSVRDALRARNIDLPGGIFESGGRSLPLTPTGELLSEKELGDVVLAGSARGSPVYLRDLFEVSRDYQSPPRYLNALTVRGPDGEMQRMRAVTLAVMMPVGEQVFEFGAEVDGLMAKARPLLPADLVIQRTSDQPLQVQETVDLFMRSLLEAIVLVVLTAFIGFWEWRSALLIALSIPLTLAMTFGLMEAVHVDLQQVSIGSLIIALGLLVDDPVVANDAIRRELQAGRSSTIAAWLGPTKLANAIVFATITNIAAYLPFLTVRDHVGDFIYALPVVLTCSLVASRIVSMTFVPLMGRTLLRPQLERESRWARSFKSGYRKMSGWVLDHRKRVLAVACLALVGAVPLFQSLRTSFFPKDLSYFFYVDVWTPEDSTFASTEQAAMKAERVIRQVADDYARGHPGEGGKPRSVLRSITSFIGGGGPRFWFSVSPEQSQLNYAQLLVRLEDKHDTGKLVPLLQRALGESMIGVSADVQQLETGEPVGVPVSIRFSGFEGSALREIGERAKGILRSIPTATRVRDDWGAETLSLSLRVDPDRANLSGVTNLDVAISAAAATNGVQVTTLRDKDREIPVTLRLRPSERSGVEDLNNLYVFSALETAKVPLQQVASMGLAMQPEKIKRRNHFPTITVSAFPAEGALASQVLAAAMPKLKELERDLPPGYRMEIAGEQEAQEKGFGQVAVALLISVALIYFVLVFEFRNAIKPLIVFAAIPFGALGVLASLSLAGVPFGFMAFLGIASLVGVIVSHVVVLFDFIEVAREEGRPLREALIEAGVVRLRPVLITVAATVLGLVPLASHGGPLWEPLCFAQIGGLSIATGVTLLLVPVLYSVFVLDLRILSWDLPKEAEEAPGEAPAHATGT
jgi:multidrug efflux pump subunit AcrB